MAYTRHATRRVRSGASNAENKGVAVVLCINENLEPGFHDW